jgi:ABC-type branched-subunit amino acid transport system substrate-binding protein
MFVACLLGLASVCVVGCGSASSHAAGAPSTESSQGGIGGPSAHALTASDVGVVRSFVGGGSGRAAGSPIGLGVITLAGGPVGAAPENNTVNAAVDLINDRLGGIGGHPLRIVTCDAAVSVQAALECGQKFRNDPIVKAVLNPGLTNGGLQLLGALNGAKAEFCDIPTEAELFGENVFCPSGGVESANATITYLRHKSGIKTVSQILPDSPSFQALASVFVKQMSANGLHATEGLIPVGSPDVLSAVVASGAQHASAIFITLTQPAECIAVARALKTLNIPASVPIVSLTSCIDPSVAKALGGLPHWTFADTGDSPYITPANAQVRAFLDTNYTYAKVPTGPFSQTLFGMTLLIARVFNEIGPTHITTAAIAAKTKEFTGPMFLGDPKIRFGTQPFPNIGSLSARFYTLDGSGKWSDATGGRWIVAPPPAK